MDRPPPTIAQVNAGLASQGIPQAHPAFLTPILSGARLPPLLSVIATTKVRLLNTDISLPNILLSSTPTLPPTLSSSSTQSTTLKSDIFVQVLDILDIGRSKWDQIEALEAERKGETTKGREVIRVVPPTTTQNDELGSSASTQALRTPAPATAGSKGPFRLLLQDWRGTRVYGFDMKSVERIGMTPPSHMGIGCKILLKRGCKVARGVVLLEPAMVNVMGGKIESLDKPWREGREARLRAEVARETPGGGGGGDDDDER